MFASGNKADITTEVIHVRFRSKGDIGRDIPALRLKSRCRFVAKRRSALSNQVFQAVRC